VAAWLVIGGGAAGVVLALSRSLGPVWVAAAVVLALAMNPQAVRRRLRHPSPLGVAAVAAVVIAVMVCVVWQVSVQPRPAEDLTNVGHRLVDSLSQPWRPLRDAVAAYGWNDTPMPSAPYATWLALVSGLVVLSLAVGNARQRLVLLAVAVGNVVIVPALVDAAIGPQLGARFALGRWMLPLFVAVPLVAGEVLRERVARLGRAGSAVLCGAVVGIAAAAQLVVIYTAGHRYAVGIDGRRAFWTASLWQPPGGWWLSILLAFTGAAALLLLVCPLLADLRRADRRCLRE
jgi:hypothetical protein